MWGRRASVSFAHSQQVVIRPQLSNLFDIIGPLSLFSPIFPEFFLTFSLLICPRGSKVRPIRKGGQMYKYRRIEVKAFRQRVTSVLGEWPHDIGDSPLTQSDDRISLNNSDLCEPVAPDSTEGQLILVEAVRSLARRLSPEARAMICTHQDILNPGSSEGVRFALKLRSFYQSVCRKALSLALKEK
jgi:hypothetical protein